MADNTINIIWQKIMNFSGMGSLLLLKNVPGLTS